MPEIIKPGNPEAQFPLGHVLTCTHCGCQFKLNYRDNYDVVTLEGPACTKKLLYVDCPNCSGPVSDSKEYQNVQSSLSTEDGQAAVGIGHAAFTGDTIKLGAESHREPFASRPLSELNPFR